MVVEKLSILLLIISITLSFDANFLDRLSINFSWLSTTLSKMAD
jgi:hypothetical protein